MTPSHAPSSRLGACDPCAAGDHGGCDAIYVGGDFAGCGWLCTCYDDSWEWHETLGTRSTL